MINAGQRDKRIIFQRFTATQDEYGEPTGGVVWTPFGKPQKAKVHYGRGDERRQAAQEQGSQAATFNCHATVTTKAVKITDRIVLGADNWDVIGISPVTRREIEFTAKRAL